MFFKTYKKNQNLHLAEKKMMHVNIINKYIMYCLEIHTVAIFRTIEHVQMYAPFVKSIKIGLGLEYIIGSSYYAVTLSLRCLPWQSTRLHQWRHASIHNITDMLLNTDNGQ